ncbi:MAG: hypothetical protein QOF62_415, partial [Pyrinomonadaceae bacterium]|nr:hypothetical protein [Pyrinomonadaceae bacterium]
MRMFVLTLLLAVFVSSATAQDTTDGATPLGIAPGAPAGSYELSGFDNVNLFNGDLNFRLPLAKVRGRGEAAYTMMLPIEQKWTVHQYRDPLYEIDKYSPRSNWWNGIKPGYGPGVLQGRGSGSQPGTCQYYFGGSMNNLKVNNTTLTRLTFIVPDGTEYEFRDQLSGGQPRPRTACAPAGAGGASRGTIFVTADGTTATFISDAAINDYYLPGQAITYPSGYLLMRDGLRYRIDNGLVSWMRDRNGNRLTFTYDASQRVTMITDSLNRQMNIAYDYSDASPYGLCDRITFNGFGGAQRIIRVSRTNLSSAFRPDFSLQTYAQLFPELNGSSTSQFNPTVASAVWLPDSDGVTRRYQFFYNNYGELARVVLPTGGAIDYNYAAGATDGVSSGVIFSYSIYRRVIDKRVYPDGVTLTTKMTFSRPESGGTSCCNYTTLSYVVVDQRDSSGTQLLSRDKHYFYGSAIGSLITPTSVAPLATSYPAWTDGREYQTEVMDTNGTTVLRRTTQTWQQRAAVSWWTGTPETAPANDPRIVETSSTLADSNQVTKQTFSYDQHNNRTDVYEYDFGSGAAPPFPLRHTHSTYLAVNPVNGISYADPANGMNYTVSDAHLRGLPTASLVYAVNPSNGAETLAAQSTIAYDEPAYSILNYGSLAGWIDPGTARGNATTTGNWLDTTGTYLQTHAQYDQAGNLRNAWDAKGNQSQVEYSSANAYAFPTLTRTPVPDPSGVYGSTASLVTTRVYDLDTGLVTSTTDANGQTTSFEYNDALDRMTKVNSPDGGRTTRIYVDAHQCGPFVETRTLLDSSGRETDSWQFVDGLGRPYLAQSLDNQDPNNPYLRVDTQYDNMGRAFRVSSPYRSTGCTSALNPSGRWTTSGFDALGRVTSVTTPDSAVVTTSYSGNTVTVTDQAGKTRKSVTDALGRLTQVYEDPNGLNYLTSYTYDVLGNLRRIDQGSQQR